MKLNTDNANFWNYSNSQPTLLYFPMQSTSSGDSGDNSTAKTHAGISIACTVSAWVSTVIGFIIIIAAVIGVVASANSQVNNF